MSKIIRNTFASAPSGRIPRPRYWDGLLSSPGSCKRGSQSSRVNSEIDIPKLSAKISKTTIEAALCPFSNWLM